MQLVNKNILDLTISLFLNDPGVRVSLCAPRLFNCSTIQLGGCLLITLSTRLMQMGRNHLLIFAYARILNLRHLMVHLPLYWPLGQHHWVAWSKNFLAHISVTRWVCSKFLTHFFTMAIIFMSFRIHLFQELHQSLALFSSIKASLLFLTFWYNLLRQKSKM